MTRVTFLAHCQAHNLDPFDPKSREHHRQAQRERRRQARSGDPSGVTATWLRTLRRLDREWAQRKAQLDELRNFNATHHGQPLDDTDAQAALDAADAAYRAHAAEHPEAADEYEARVEQARLEEELAQAIRQHDAAALRLASTAEPVAPDPTARDAAQARLEALTATHRALEQEALALEEQYHAAEHLPPPQRAQAYDACRAIARKLRLAGRKVDKAHQTHRDHVASYERRLARYAERRAEYGRLPAEVALAEHRVTQLHAQLAQVRTRIPDVATAPLKEPRAPRAQARSTPAQARADLRKRYIAGPDGVLRRRLRSGGISTVKSTTVMVDGLRLPVGYVHALLTGHNPSRFESQALHLPDDAPTHALTPAPTPAPTLTPAQLAAIDPEELA